jgi:hypothetical protein
MLFFVFFRQPRPQRGRRFRYLRQQQVKEGSLNDQPDGSLPAPSADAREIASD